jgi:hypothetical protein
MPLTVVGQSMAGFVAPSVAAELDADHLVLLNAMEPEALVSMSHRAPPKPGDGLWRA